MKAFVVRICVLAFIAEVASTAQILKESEEFELASAARVFKPAQLKNAVLHAASRPRDGIQCASATLIHQDIQPTRVRGDVFWVPHSMIIHNGLRCGTGKRSEYMLVVNGRDIVKRSIAKERGLLSVYDELKTNARGINSFIALNPIDPVHLGIEMSAHRQCGGRVMYPRGSVFLFMSPSQTNINLGFAFFPKFSVGMISVLNNQNLCAFVNGEPTGFVDAKPSTSPVAPVSAAPKDPYALDDPVFSTAPSPSPSQGSASPAPMASRAVPVKSTPTASLSPKRSTVPKSPKPSASGKAKAAALSPSPTKSPIAAAKRKECFPNLATVELESGQTVAISSLKIGDRVRTGQNSFSSIFMFTHKENMSWNDFVQIETKSQAVVQLSEGHYIRTNGKLTVAGNVVIGDTISLALGRDDDVVAVTKVSMEGLHNPQTIDGNIAVNGIIASCFTSAVDPSGAHSLLAPARALFLSGIWQTPLKGVFHNSDHGLVSWLPKCFSSAQNCNRTPQSMR